MEKLGKILFLILNICIDTFLVLIGLILFLWAIFGIRPEDTVQKNLVWIQYSWDSLWGIEPQKDSTQISPKFRRRAHRQIYVSEPNKKDKSAKDIVTQPYKQEK